MPKVADRGTTSSSGEVRRMLAGSHGTGIIRNHASALSAAPLLPTLVRSASAAVRVDQGT
jgi:hypothetical protein